METPSPPRGVLPPIDECLFGPTRRMPKIPDLLAVSSLEREDSLSDSVNSSLAEDEEVDDAVNTSEDADTMKSPLADGSIEDDYDTFHLGHWGQAATQHDISMAQLRKVASVGIPDEGSFRAIAWRVLLHYLPSKDINESWATQVPPKREFYKQLVDQYFESSMESGQGLRGQQNKKTKNRKAKKKSNKLRSTNDDPNDSGRVPVPANEIETALPNKFKEQWRSTGLTLDHLTTATSETIDLRLNCLRIPNFTDDSPQEDFDDFLEDATLLEEIRKDVARTLSHLLFFLDTSDDLGLRRYAALERILFLWAKLNKGVRYVQGMNEIAGTLYYVMANDENCEWANHAEADTYFLFHTLMMDIRDVFVPDMDSHATGIQGRIGNMQRLLQTHDPAVFEHLQACGIDSHFYAYRWLTTLLSREFLLPDTIRLWDSMFASTHKENFLRYVCVTMVMYVRDELLEGDFSSNLKLLQRYPPTNVDAILESSRHLWKYETLVGVACQKRGISWQEAIQLVNRPPNIIMAFGYKGGIVPNFQDRLENATGNIMGRAQRLWSGWGKEQPDATQDEMAAVTSTDIPSFAPPPPPLARIWNRVRGNTNDSDDNLALVKESSPSSDSGIGAAGMESTTSSSTPMAKKDDPPAIQPAISDPTPRRRIWNQSPSTRAPDNSVNPPDVLTPQSGVTVPPLPSLRSSPSLSTSMPVSEEPSSSSSAMPQTVTPEVNSGSAVRRLWNLSVWKTESTATS